MNTEFKHAHGTDLITGYAPDMEKIKQDVYKQNRILVESWHQGGDFASRSRREKIKTQGRVSAVNLRAVQQNQAESPLQELWNRWFGLKKTV